MKSGSIFLTYTCVYQTFIPMNLLHFFKKTGTFSCILLLLLNVACGDKDESWVEFSGNTGLEAIPWEGGSYPLEVRASGEWRITGPGEDWCVVSPAEGQGNGEVSFRIGRNYGEARSASVVLESRQQARVLVVRQNAHYEDTAHVVRGRLEIPRLAAGRETKFIVHDVLFQGNWVRNYSLEYDFSKMHARWVAFQAYDGIAADQVSRTKPEPWADDPELSTEYHTTRADYTGYDRGHLVASNDRRYCREANVQTFYYSNISPQLAAFNQNIWQKLEENVKAWMQDGALRDTLYVVKGGSIREDQILTFTGPHRVAVPQFYFMAILARKNNSYKSIAFWLEHKAYQQPYELQKKALSVDELEERTGIDFFPGLPDKTEDRVESEFDVNDWEWTTL